MKLSEVDRQIAEAWRNANSLTRHVPPDPHRLSEKDMALHLGFHHRTSDQQHEIREAKKFLKERLRNDWDYPPLPRFQIPVRSAAAVRDNADDVEQRIAGFKVYSPSNHEREALLHRTPEDLQFEPAEWRERDYSSEAGSSEEESLVARTSSNGSKASTYRFEGPDSVGTQLSDRKLARKRKRQKLLDEEVSWNDGMAHWLARRDVWCGAHTSQQIQMLESRREQAVDSTTTSNSSTPRTSTSSASQTDGESEPATSPSTTPELLSEPARILTEPPAPPSEILVPVVPPILTNHPVRKRITPEVYPEIYTKIILQSRTPSVPINLMTMIRALVQGWKDDGEWPPKQGPMEKGIARKKGSGHESSLKSGVRAVGRVLRITGVESSVSGSSKDKG